MQDRRVDLAWRAIAVLLAAMVVAGCASSDAPEPAAPGASATSTAPATTTTPTTGGTAAAILVDYRRSGGLAGLEDHLVVTTDGRAMAEGKGPSREERLGATTMRELTAALDQAGLDRLQPRSDPNVKGNDLFEYVITYRGHTVTASDAGMPPQLRPLLTKLNRIVAEVRTS